MRPISHSHLAPTPKNTCIRELPFLFQRKRIDLTAKKEESIGQPLERLPQTICLGRHVSPPRDEIVNGLQQLGEDHGISEGDVETRDLPLLPHKRKEDEVRSAACSG